MGKLITLPFQFDNKEYVLLVQIKKVEDHEEFHVTAITGDLQAKIYANYIFSWDGINSSIIKTPLEKLATPELAGKIWHTIYEYIVLEEQNSKQPDA